MKVIEPGFATTVQDLGRRRYQRFGVPVAGAMDAYALMAANHLVGNPFGAAVLETALAGFKLWMDQDCVIAGAGRGFELIVEEMKIPLWKSVLVKSGQTVQLHETDESGWGYLAVSGGIQVPPLLGSRSTYLPGGWEGFSSRTLQENDELSTGGQFGTSTFLGLAGRNLPEEMIPGYENLITARFIPTNTNDVITATILEQFQTVTYRIDQTSRMAYRLTGEPLPVSGTTDILSEGVGAGVIQLLGSGQPLVLMRDAQTTGGYAKLGTVITADVGMLAQYVGEPSQIRFSVTTVEDAQSHWRKRVNNLLSLTWDESEI
jgi:biotin-dependent carboxylase-like uncharacterized protein